MPKLIRLLRTHGEGYANTNHSKSMTEAAGYQTAVIELMILHLGPNTVCETPSTKFQPARFPVACLRQDQVAWARFYERPCRQTRGESGEIIGGQRDE